MKRSTSVRHHSRTGTKGVKRHSREVSSPDDNIVPHDSLEEVEEALDGEEE